MPGFLTNDLPMLGQVAANMQVALDTEFPRGANPASIAATAFQVAALFAEAAATALTSTAGAVTSNTSAGLVTTEALTTAPNTNYTFTLTDNLITAAYIAAGLVPQAVLLSGTNTGGSIPPTTGAALRLVSVTPTVGQAVFVWQNVGNSALNGTMRLVFHL